MDLALNDVLVWLGGMSVTGYVGYVHNRLSGTDRRLTKHEVKVPETYVAKDDYRDDMNEMKEMMREMRSDVKSILGGRQ